MYKFEPLENTCYNSLRSSIKLFLGSERACLLVNASLHMNFKKHIKNRLLIYYNFFTLKNY